MSDNPGRGYLPPTVPAPGPHRRQWPFNFFSNQWQQPGKQFIMAPSSPPQSESMDLSSRPDVNGGEVNGGSGVSVIATNPLVAEEKPGKMQADGARVLPLPAFSGLEEKVPTHPTEGASPPDLPAGSRTPPTVAGPVPPPVSLPLAPPIPTPVSVVLPPSVPSPIIASFPTPSPAPGPTLAPTSAPMPSPTPPVAPAPMASFPTPDPLVASVPTPALAVASAPTPTPPVAMAPPISPAPHPPPLDLIASPGLVDPDHVESLLENMFQGEAKPSVIVTNCTRTAPALTEDKVVEILQDKDTSLTELKLEEDTPAPPPAEKPLEKAEEVKEVKEEPIESQFMEVESELEKMFAGIEEEKKPTPEESEILPQNKAKVKRPSKPRQRKSTDSIDGKKRKAKKEKARPKKTKREKDNSNDSSIASRNFKGPYVHVEGTKENPVYIGVVNSGGKDEEEKERADKRKHHALVEGRVKGSHLYSSTLSSKYNSQSLDPTWVCAFCKKRAHCEGGLGGEPAGDLFGPYILTVPKTSGDVDRSVPSDREVAAEQKKKGGGKAASLRAVGAADAFINSFSKKSKKASLQVGEECGGDCEVWVHEKCAVWAPGVYLAGPHLVGLPQAVASAASTRCSVCGTTGACIGCVRRGCSGRVHYGCGLAGEWLLDENEYISLCPPHAVKKEKPKKVK